MEDGGASEEQWNENITELNFSLKVYLSACKMSNLFSEILLNMISYLKKTQISPTSLQDTFP